MRGASAAATSTTSITTAAAATPAFADATAVSAPCEATTHRATPRVPPTSVSLTYSAAAISSTLPAPSKSAAAS